MRIEHGHRERISFAERLHLPQVGVKVFRLHQADKQGQRILLGKVRCADGALARFGIVRQRVVPEVL